MPEDLARSHIKAGELVVVLEDWLQPVSGFHLDYPSRKHASPAFTLVVDAHRYRPPARR